MVMTTTNYFLSLVTTYSFEASIYFRLKEGCMFCGITFDRNEMTTCSFYHLKAKMRLHQSAQIKFFWAGFSKLYSDISEKIYCFVSWNDLLFIRQYEKSCFVRKTGDKITVKYLKLTINCNYRHRTWTVYRTFVRGPDALFKIKFSKFSYESVFCFR